MNWTSFLYKKNKIHIILLIIENLLVNQTNVSKEVKKENQISVGLNINFKNSQRQPYVCTGCKSRYNNCPYTKY